MRYMMKQKIWAMGNDFTIKNENNESVYLIDGKAFSFGDKLSFQDSQGNELAYISQKLLSFKKCYEIYNDGELFAEVRKDFTLFRDKYTVDIPGPNDYEVRGDFFDHEYSFYRKGIEVAMVSKSYFTWSDVFGIDIIEGEDDVLILAAAVVIDLVNDDKEY